MKETHTFNNADYYTALSNRANGGIRIYRVARQRGGSFGGNVVKLFSKYVVPLFNRYILPSAKDNLVSFANDMLDGASFKSAVKKNSKSFAKDVVSNLQKPQTGGRRRKRNRVINFNLSFVCKTKTVLTSFICCFNKIRKKSKSERRQKDHAKNQAGPFLEKNRH